jgi:hypothetical protein
MKQILLGLSIVVTSLQVVAGYQTPSAAQSQKDTHTQHQSEVDKRGDQAMGFSHAKTTHHFRLKTDGGAIEATANDPNDGASRDQIRHHLAHIAELFSKGDFSLPMFTHGEAPPGTAEMTRLKTDIKYTFEAIDRGGRVLIVSANPEAIDAVHQFLRFQIKDHQTGDSLDVDKR